MTLTLFIQMTGTVAVIVVMTMLLTNLDSIQQFSEAQKRIPFLILVGLVGGLFGIYGNITGTEFQGAVISVRDIGPMLAGFIGGPLSGLLAGIICGAHRLLLGGLTAKACILATCFIGTTCGLIYRFRKNNDILSRPFVAFLVGAAMECIHLSLVLLIVRPFETALEIVQTIAMPFILINAIGFALMIGLIHIVEKQRAMAAERNKLQSELAVAEVIQRSMLPSINDTFPGREEVSVAASMKPAREVGGDFYDLFFVDSDRIAFVVADVSGKGVPAAMFMMRAKQILQNAVKDMDDLADAVGRTNNGLCEGNEAEMFVTAWIGVMELDTGRVTFVNAGHNPPLLRSGKTNTYLREKGGFVLGGMESVVYRTGSFTMEPGDCLFIYTDGVTEAENSTHALYGEDRLLSCFDELSETADQEDILAAVNESLSSFVGKADQFDDITMFCVRRN